MLTGAGPQLHMSHALFEADDKKTRLCITNARNGVTLVSLPAMLELCRRRQIFFLKVVLIEGNRERQH